jgi:hypothetical protein
MNRKTRRLGAVLVSTFAALGLSVGTAAATEMQPPRHRDADVSQELKQEADTDQTAESKAKSFQVIPVNANVPISGLAFDHGGMPNGKDSYGKDKPDRCDKCGYGKDRGNDVTQTNDASARSSAENQSVTVQYADQDQHVTTAPKPGYGHKPQPPKEHPSKGKPTNGYPSNGHPSKGHGGGGVSQELDQDSDTDQYAKSEAESFQFVPINANVPISVLSKGSNNGDVEQTNDASVRSEAENKSFTGQFAEQDQSVGTSNPTWSRPPCGCDAKGGDVSQDLDQDADTDQYAKSEAESHQFVPINANVPISVLSHGSNNGDVEQTNDASAKSEAENESVTIQAADQDQTVSGPAASGGTEQEAEQDADTDQTAKSEAESQQVLPINANVPISALSHGSNNGDVEQTNDASAESEAENESTTVQIGSQTQSVR